MRSHAKDQGLKRAIEMLLVEDDPDDVEVIRRLVSRSALPIRLLIAPDGRSALDQFLIGSRTVRTPSPPDVVLLDIGLPGLGGIEVLRRLKGDPDLRGVPIVVLSASSSDRHVVEGRELGAHSHVVKPMDANTFAWITASIWNYQRRVESLHMEEGGNT